MNTSTSDYGTIESPLFDWENWDEQSVGTLFFYDVTFKRNVGPFKPGDKAAGVSLMFEWSKIQVEDENGELLYTGRLVLGVEDE